MVESREALARLLGLSGPDADLVLAGPLPPVPAEGGLFVRAAEADGVPTAVVDLAAIERAAVEASLELAAARADIETAAQRAGLADIEGLVPEVEIGGEAERDDGDWKAGPEVGLVLPLFDQGQARSAAARGAVRRAQALYYATAVDVRSAARTLGQRLATTRRAALHYQTTVLPLRAALVQQTLLQYNAMQTGVFGLLDAQRQEAEAAAYIRDHMTKPVAAYIAGLSAPKGRRMVHAGAIVSAFGESAQEKVEILGDAGVTIVPTPSSFGEVVAKMVT